MSADSSIVSSFGAPVAIDKEAKPAASRKRRRPVVTAAEKLFYAGPVYMFAIISSYSGRWYDDRRQDRRTTLSREASALAELPSDGEMAELPGDGWMAELRGDGWMAALPHPPLPLALATRVSRWRLCTS